MRFKNITVVIPCGNEHYCDWTVNNVFETADKPDHIVVIVVCDRCLQDHDVQHENVKYLRTRGHDLSHGVGPARHEGIMSSPTSLIMTLDAHMSLQNGWDTIIYDHFNKHPDDIACCALKHRSEESEWKDPNDLHFENAYTAARIELMEDKPNHNGHSVFVSKWARTPKSVLPKEEYCEVPCILGAMYVMTKDTYIHCASPWRMLKVWGWSEAAMSLSAWVMGHRSVILPIKTGHWYKADGQGFNISPWPLIYNQDILIECLPMSSGLRKRLRNHVNKDKFSRYKQSDYDAVNATKGAFEVLRNSFRKTLEGGRKVDEFIKKWEGWK